MPYYILHMNKDVHHYVCADVLSDSSYESMPYYTHHKHMDAHSYVYHRNIHIQHCVHDDVHSEDPVKNRKVKH